MGGCISEIRKFFKHEQGGLFICNKKKTSKPIFLVVVIVFTFRLHPNCIRHNQFSVTCPVINKAFLLSTTWNFFGCRPFHKNDHLCCTAHHFAINLPCVFTHLDGILLQRACDFVHSIDYISKCSCAKV